MQKSKDEDGNEKISLTPEDLKVTVWPLEGEEHPIDPDNIVEESIHERFHEMATKHVN